MTSQLLDQLVGESAAARYSVGSILGDLAVAHELTVVKLGGKLANDPDGEIRTIAWDSLHAFFDRPENSEGALSYQLVAELISMLPGA